MIEFVNVTKTYKNGSIVAIKDVSFTIKKKEFVFVVGASGAGKSTLVKLMLREFLPNSGKIIIENFDVKKMSKRKIPFLRRNIGVVFQDFRLLPNKTVFENVSFAMEIIECSSKQIKKEVPKILELVGISNKSKMKPFELSGGEQQRVSLARAIVNNPKIVIADEPTGNLDFDTSFEIMSLLKQINKNGVTVIIVTHAQEFTAKMKKRLIKLENGSIVKDEI
ncbi:MAG: cell division ATP-binding protein FtsE [Clostridiales bacterium]|jgi:cell division transport system ATP-binding protein|nr:cell division ATP-binding protein FtsE [Clostridiales bacterium]